MLKLQKNRSTNTIYDNHCFNLNSSCLKWFVCLFGVFRPTREFFTNLETQPLPMKGCKFDLSSALMAVKQ